MRCWTVLLLVAACRYGFDPIDVPDAASGALVAPSDGKVACSGPACVVDCRTWPSCEVDCGTALACIVRCPDVGCVVTSCTAGDCDVLCGSDFHEATYLATTATCP